MEYAIEIDGLSKFFPRGRGKKFSFRFRDLLSSPKSASELQEASGEGTWALRDVSLKIKKGETLGIIGANGAGKSTLLKILARVSSPTNGVIVGRGRVVSLLELGMGFQADLTGRENVFLNAALHGVSEREIADAFDRIVAFSELEKSIDQPVKRYSTGMYLRLAFAIAINVNPDILIADEVLAVGDIAFQRRCLDAVGELQKRGGTTLFVSHDMNAVSSICTSAIWLDLGRIHHSGSPQEVIDAYERYVFAKALNADIRPGRVGRNSFLSIENARLIDEDGHERSSVEVGKNVHFEILVKILSPIDSAYIGLDVTAVGKSESFRVFRVFQPSFSPSQLGLYRCLCTIPYNYFADHKYEVFVGARARVGESEYPVVFAGSLRFRAYQVDTLEVQATGQRSKGLVSPPADWSWSVAQMRSVENELVCQSQDPECQ